MILFISKVDLVIGPDTGPTHISWALNVPSITLFGPTPSWRNSFETKKNRSIASGSIVNAFKINKRDYSIRNININKVIGVNESNTSYITRSNLEIKNLFSKLGIFLIG